ncbi:uncharacterized protein RHOBADRAFT_41960 [Rhodotorula graminis WP1]|uniref:Uncharacterized protein n=1 Tax=Rhodotorula graminis (strain WP1) TaxID=578459 RepID=A0A194S833_RHOGW|nr:uncharacterized protein RHOBADRAFT_41960 [Rhodotorula graminis WP1]KPV76752.1 hypothetical protein RHOBADRAFT_41960 [Rhodotorula graminis WP1]
MLEGRTVTQDAGERIQDWVASRSPDSVFAITVTSCFVAFLVVASAVSSTVLRCRSSLVPHDRWHRLPDGSTYRERDDAYTGPVGTLDAHAMSGRYGAYDPPMASQMGFPGPLAQVEMFPPAQASVRPQSVGTVESRWSDLTKVGDEQLKPQDKPTSLFLPSQPPPPAPVSPQPSAASIPVPFAAPTSVPIKHLSAPSISNSLATAVDLPLPGSPRTSPAPPTSGESAFSTPKAAATPPASSPRAPVVAGRPTHTRGASSGGFKPLALSSSARSLSSSSVLSGPEPPKVELKRTWSFGTWIPQLKEGSAGTRKEDGGDEEERAGLVGRS